MRPLEESFLEIFLKSRFAEITPSANRRFRFSENDKSNFIKIQVNFIILIQFYKHYVENSPTKVTKRDII